MRVTAETKAATRERILKAARERFEAQGFEATTTRDIARAAKIAAGTLFNYFPTKEAIVECLVSEAHRIAATKFAQTMDEADVRTLEEELFAFLAAVLRKLNPYRKYLPAILETSLSPLAKSQDEGETSLRIDHLEIADRIVNRHGRQEGLSALALQIYWTLVTGVLAFWSNDRSPRQEDTLALLDQSLAMFVSWLTCQGGQDPTQQEGG